MIGQPHTHLLLLISVFRMFMTVYFCIISSIFIGYRNHMLRIVFLAQQIGQSWRRTFAKLTPIADFGDDFNRKQMIHTEMYTCPNNFRRIPMAWKFGISIRTWRNYNLCNLIVAALERFNRASAIRYLVSLHFNGKTWCFCDFKQFCFR